MTSHLSRQEKISLLKRISKGQAGLKDIYPPSGHSFEYNGSNMIRSLIEDRAMTFDEAARIINTPNMLVWIQSYIYSESPDNQLQELYARVNNPLGHLITWSPQSGNAPLIEEDGTIHI